jgi:glycine cleavage system transcriptional repressor
MRAAMMSETETQFVISIMSRDRVGIVYEISKAISEMGGNIADIRQSVMCGYFTMILLATFPPGVTQRDIERKLAAVDAHSETAIDAAVKAVDREALASCSPVMENAYVLTATGMDKVGFVATVTSFCVKHELNILDLSTTVSNGAYVMILIVDLNHCASIGDVRQDLQAFSAETGLHVVLQHYDIFRAVNEINLTIRETQM